mmetsp:Transcript_5070/g.5920  ORF Transcript_5070/g.5920 Transcript_5070/m.5920 type:complete len:208 (-) Transcript_5070:443-1066(-)
MVEVTILRASDGSKHKIKIALSETLNALKHKISICPTVTKSAGGCSITPKHQRVFHLGRELKSGKRSLAVLGIGKYNAFLVHLMSSLPEPLELSSDEEDVEGEEEDDVAVVVVASSRKKRKERSFAAAVRGGGGGGGEQVVEVVDDDDDVVEVDVTRDEATIRQGQEGRSSDVVDLLESDDDDVIEVQPSSVNDTSADTTFTRPRRL